MLCNDEINKVREHLRYQYVGVFDEQQVERHIQNYIGLELAEQQVDLVLKGGEADHLLDIGSGFGTFVLAARCRGLDAIGIDIVGFEVGFARERLQKVRPQDNPDEVYRIGDAQNLPFKSESFDVVTLWNVLEHIPDYYRVIREVVRVLRFGGRIYVVCPNYAAFHEEAHYHIFWPPFLPRIFAVKYLKIRKRNPNFFQTSIFCHTSWGILRTLKQTSLEVSDLRLEKLSDLSLINNHKISFGLAIIKRLRMLGIVRLLLRIALHNPLKQSVVLCARKR